MTYYNSLVAEKLKAISEIQRINKQIDAHKKDKTDHSEQLEKIHQLKTQLEMINSQILSYTMSPNADLALEDTIGIYPEQLSAPDSAIDKLQENSNNDSAGLLTE